MTGTGANTNTWTCSVCSRINTAIGPCPCGCTYTKDGDYKTTYFTDTHWEKIKPAAPAVGWECPRCGAINAPFVTQCTCRGTGALPPPGDVPYSPYRPIGPAPWLAPTAIEDPWGPGRMAPHTTCHVHT